MSIAHLSKPGMAISFLIVAEDILQSTERGNDQMPI
jgi:hypothetical protein